MVARQIISALNSNLSKRPFFTNLAMGASLGASGDLVAQIALENKNFQTFDWIRFATMSSFNGLYPSIVSVRVFALYPRIIPTAFKSTRLREGLSSALIDCCLHSPLLYLPAFYIYSGFSRGESAVKSLLHYKDQFADCMEALLAVWVPAQTLNFSVIPPKQRVIFVGVVNLGWNSYIDYKNHH